MKSIEINPEDLQLQNKVFFENKELLINSNNLKRFLSFLKKNVDIRNIIERDEKLIFPIPNLKHSESFKYITKDSKNSIYSYRFPVESLMIPFVKKDDVSNIKALKEYQVEGVNWLLKEPSRILADDMGLGKTLQALSASTKAILNGSTGTVLIACPSSLVFNWCKEIEKWFPEMKVSAFMRLGKNKEEFWNKLFGFNHFVVTNYEQIRDINIEDLKINFGLIIADEAHKLRKGSSKIHKKISLLNYENFWALTGTPIEKNNKDVCHLMKLVDQNRNLTSDLDKSNLSLRSELRKYLLKRNKSDVLKDLSGFLERDIYVELGETQKSKYLEVLKEREAIGSSHLKIYNKLKELCDLDPSSGSSTKIDYIMELLEKIREAKEKAVIFSFWLKPLFELEKKINTVFGKNNSVIFTGELEGTQREEALQKFKTSEEHNIFLCSGKIGGEGINLTEANHAIFFNRWWNPSNNAQARDRLVRIGQKNLVFVYNIVTGDSVENDLFQILESKKKITNEVIERLVADA